MHRYPISRDPRKLAACSGVVAEHINLWDEHHASYALGLSISALKTGHHPEPKSVCNALPDRERNSPFRCKSSLGDLFDHIYNMLFSCGVPSSCRRVSKIQAPITLGGGYPHFYLAYCPSNFDFPLLRSCHAHCSTTSTAASFWAWEVIEVIPIRALGTSRLLCFMVSSASASSERQSRSGISRKTGNKTLLSE